MNNEIIIKSDWKNILYTIYIIHNTYNKIKVTNDKHGHINKTYRKIYQTSCDFRFEDDTRVSTAHLGGIVILLLYQFQFVYELKNHCTQNPFLYRYSSRSTTIK